MKTVRLLLVNGHRDSSSVFVRKIQQNDAIRFQIAQSPADQAEELFDDLYERLDIVLLGPSVAAQRSAGLTRSFRERKPSIPVFLLSMEAGSSLPRLLRRAGVDDILNINDIDSPLFAWTFTSTVENATLRKKAQEYDQLYSRLQDFKSGFGRLVHDLNNPLSVIRLALYHIDNANIPPEKHDTYLRLLIDNVRRVESRIGEFHTLKRQIDGDRATRTKIISIRPPVRSSGRR